MKKLIVLSLVVAMASLATAGLASLELTADGNLISVSGSGAVATGANNFGVQLTGGADVLAVSGYTISATTPFTLTVMQHSATPAILGAPWGFIGAQVGTGWAADVTNTTGSVSSSTAEFFTFTSTGIGFAQLIDLNTGATYGDLVAVPEPMTMALLGLGGLFLRRKK